ncbi:hypothetical protein [Sphingopyxis sp. KK2]|uniref:hypothetical protein n=1 Tax=Sphingopyxis sp. KK2 TaxID=1855727 RepID=UPI00097E7128|nr:hypothetical protein [Sphingopyxis sp. KK2]
MMSILLSLALAAAAAENPPADGATTTQPAKPEKPKKICKTTKMTGSNLGKRVCKTQEQWDNIARDGAQSLDLVDQGYKTMSGNGAVN